MMSSTCCSGVITRLAGVEPLFHSPWQSFFQCYPTFQRFDCKVFLTDDQPLRSELRRGAKSTVPLADRAIGNPQGWLIGTYHGVSKAQLQVYLDEFVFRHNRRKTPAAAFQTLLGLGTGRKSTEYEQIRGARDLNHNQLGVAEATR